MFALDKRSQASRMSAFPPLFLFLHPLWVLHAFCGNCAASFHISLLGDTKILQMHPAIPTLSLHLYHQQLSRELVIYFWAA
jgi:hypothetical protein